MWWKIHSFFGKSDGMKYSDKNISDLNKEMQSCKDDKIDMDDDMCCDDHCCYGDD